MYTIFGHHILITQVSIMGPLVDDMEIMSMVPEQTLFSGTKAISSNHCTSSLVYAVVGVSSKDRATSFD